MLLRAIFRGAVLLTCACMLAAPAFSQNPAQTSSGIHVSVDRVNVGVLVTDSHGQFVGGLHREDFHVFDDGVEQPITDFLSVDEPARVLLLVEAGPAVYLLQGGHLEAVQALLEGLSPNDSVAIARYDEAAQLILSFTPDKSVAAGALDQLHFNLGFGQLNLASNLNTVLDWLARVPGKKSVVLLSSGVDTSPAPAVQNLLARLKSTDVRVLAVSLGGELRVAKQPEKKRSKKEQAIPPKTQAVDEVFAQADAELAAIAQANGGRAFFPVTSTDFVGVFAEIAQLVRHEYSLGFVPPVRDGKLHLLEVRVGDSPLASPENAAPDAPPAPAYRIDHRQAYFAPAERR
jgi:Ca-activated chloride channel homolog